MKVVIPGGSGLLGAVLTNAFAAEGHEIVVLSRTAAGEAIASCVAPPCVWLQASTATIYSHRYDAPNDEHTGVLGGDEVGVPETWRFSIDVARAWERALEDSETPHTRKVALRTAIVMSPDRGGLSTCWGWCDAVLAGPRATGASTSPGSTTRTSRVQSRGWSRTRCPAP